MSDHGSRDTCISERGMATIVGCDKRYRVCGGAHGFYDAGELIRKHHPDVQQSLNVSTHSRTNNTKVVPGD